jgi:hypothetical protein
MMDTRFLEWSEDALLEAIGEQIEDEVLGMFPRPKARAKLREKALKWYEENSQVFRDTICRDEKVKRYLDSPEVDLLFHAMCEAITMLALGVPAGLLAAYIIKRGVRTLCRE